MASTDDDDITLVPTELDDVDTTPVIVHIINALYIRRRVWQAGKLSRSVEDRSMIRSYTAGTLIISCACCASIRPIQKISE
jgi:hypothetical protein